MEGNQVNVNTGFISGTVEDGPRMHTDAKGQTWANFIMVRSQKAYNCCAKGSTATHIGKTVKPGDTILCQYHLDDYSKHDMALFVDFVNWQKRADPADAEGEV